MCYDMIKWVLTTHWIAFSDREKKLHEVFIFRFYPIYLENLENFTVVFKGISITIWTTPVVLNPEYYNNGQASSVQRFV